MSQCYCRRYIVKKAIALLLIALLAMGIVPVLAQDGFDTGNVIFFHPDGTGLNHWNAGRMYWEGPDGSLNWDMLPEMAVYRGHMMDRLTGTSHGGATVHAFGYKVLNDSFGQDETRTINSLSGFEGSIMREAATAGMPIGLVNDGDLAEPGTAVFVSEVDDRGESEEIVRQILDGREGFEGEPMPEVMLAGGEAWFLPADTPMCEDEITLDCFVHLNPFNGAGPTREDGRNLLQEFADAGYEIVRTRAEFEDLWQRIQDDPEFTPLVLGLFGRDDIFNDETEEELIEAGLVDDSMAGTKEGRLVLWGGLPDSRSYNPPTVAEMSTMALEVLSRHSEAAGMPFFLVAESESNDNLPNNANAIGMLNAVRRADDTVGVFRDYIEANPETLLIMAADSDGGAPQVFGPPPIDEDGNVTVSAGNPTNVIEELDFGFPLDGIEGQGTAPFVAAPNAFGDELEFAIGWPGRNDVAGAILSRAQGLNAELLRTEFRTQFDSSDVYRLMYTTLFGELLPASYGELAPTRGE
ncbi:MAG: alkaline phosphatase [Chloroflexi bacterium]|nr:alkaline phosphatase [Chloroflexota bacterium]